MNRTKLLAVVILAIAGLSGCATTRTQDLAHSDARDAAAPAEKQVSRPASYGSRGGYRYRRLVAVTIPSG